MCGRIVSRNITVVAAAAANAAATACYGLRTGFKFCVFVSLTASVLLLVWSCPCLESCALASHDSSGSHVTWHHMVWQTVTTCAGHDSGGNSSHSDPLMSFPSLVRLISLIVGLWLAWDVSHYLWLMMTHSGMSFHVYKDCSLGAYPPSFCLNLYSIPCITVVFFIITN